MRSTWLVGALLAWCAAPCVAQENPSVSAAADLSTISLGDRITLTVQVEHELNETVVWPSTSDSLGSFEVVGYNELPPVANDGRQVSSMRLQLTTFELGELEIPAIEVAVVDSGGVDHIPLSTEPIAVVVESVGIDESGDIRTVKAPLEIPRNLLLLLPWLVLTSALAGLVYWLYRRYRARDKTPGELLVPATPPRPP